MEVLLRFAATVLAPAALSKSSPIDLDYASSAYWQKHWPVGTRPASFLDGSKGRDVLIANDRAAAIKMPKCGSGYFNPPGLKGGKVVQRCWSLFEHDHRTGWLDSGVWTGFTVEQFLSLQGCGAPRHPLSEGVTTIVPSRRGRYRLHPDAMIALLSKKLRRQRDKAERKVLNRLIARLLGRKNDAPIPSSAPPHGSYVSILWSHSRSIRQKQARAAKQFLAEQAKLPKTFFQTVAVIGGWPA